MPAEGLKNNGTLFVIFIAHISCQPMMSCKIITDVVMLFVGIVSGNHHFYMINKQRVLQIFCPTFQEYVYVWLDISWNSRKCRKFLLILNYLPNGPDMVPILHNYFAWNYKIEMLMENRNSNNKQITQYDFFIICNSKNHWFSQWIREGLLCQARFKTQTYTCGIPLNLFLISVLIRISLWGRSRWQGRRILGWPSTMNTSKYMYTWRSSCWKQPGDWQERLFYNQNFKERSTCNQVGREKKWLGQGPSP